MGNLCGKPSKENDPFAQPGRTLGSVPAKPSEPRASIATINSRGQTLGGSRGGGAGDSSDARSAAAKAAEVGDDSFDRLAPRFKNHPDTGRLLTML